MSGFIHIEGLKKAYEVGGIRVEALKGITHRIGRADFVVVLGHSGSGKTTLISAVGGLTRPTEGNVYIEGTDIWTLKDRELSILRNSKIGFIFQSFSLLPSLNVLNNVVIPVVFSRNSGGKEDSLREKAISLLDDLDMKSKMESYPSELSGGEQRRVAIARALINDPEIILADEPTGELDIRTEHEVIEIFRHINEKYKKTIVVVSHSLTWAKKAKTVIVMKDGLMYKDIDDPVRALMGEVCKS